MSGMTSLTLEQTDATEQIFGRRYLTIEAQPEHGNRKHRRDQKRARRRRPDRKPYGGR